MKNCIQKKVSHNPSAKIGGAMEISLYKKVEFCNTTHNSLKRPAASAYSIKGLFYAFAGIGGSIKDSFNSFASNSGSIKDSFKAFAGIGGSIKDSFNAFASSSEPLKGLLDAFASSSEPLKDSLNAFASIFKRAKEIGNVLVNKPCKIIYVDDKHIF